MSVSVANGLVTAVGAAVTMGATGVAVKAVARHTSVRSRLGRRAGLCVVAGAVAGLSEALALTAVGALHGTAPWIALPAAGAVLASVAIMVAGRARERTTEAHQIGPYRLEGVLGSGATGTVFAARSPNGQRVALKLLHPALAADPAYRTQLRHEAAIMRRISHANCVQVLDVLDDGATLAIVAEFVNGATLEAVLGRSKTLSGEDATALMEGVLMGLDHLHRQGLVHRDVKPANIIVTPDGTAKLTDFGLTRHVSDLSHGPPESIGSPAYMSPEQAAGSGVGPWSDLYSCGAVLFEMFTGRRVFASGDGAEVMRLQREASAPDPRSIRPDLHPAIAHVVNQALAKNPAERHRSAHELFVHLDAAAVAAHGPAWRQRAALSGLAAAAMAAGGGTAALLATGSSNVAAVAHALGNAAPQTSGTELAAGVVHHGNPLVGGGNLGRQARTGGRLRGFLQRGRNPGRPSIGASRPHPGDPLPGRASASAGQGGKASSMGGPGTSILQPVVAVGISLAMAAGAIGVGSAFKSGSKAAPPGPATNLHPVAITDLPALASISCADAEHCVAVGGNDEQPPIRAVAVATSDGGRTWQTYALAPQLLNDLSGVTCPTATRCLAWGHLGSDPGAGDVVLVSDDGAKTWRRQYQVGAGISIGRLTCPDAEHCVAAASDFPLGSSSYAFATTDGGQHWTRTQFQGGDGELAPDVVCADTSRCVRTSIKIATTADGGHAWRPEHVPAGVAEFGPVTLEPNGHGAGFGDTCAPQAGGPGTNCHSVALTSDDAGTTWRAGSAPVPSGQTVTCQKSVCLAAFINTRTGVEDAIGTSNDGGATWHTAARWPGKNLSSVTCTPVACYAVGTSTDPQGGGVLLSAIPGTETAAPPTIPTTSTTTLAPETTTTLAPETTTTLPQPRPTTPAAPSGHGSPGAAVVALLQALNDNNFALACSYAEPSQQAACNSAYATFGQSGTRWQDVALGTVEVQGTRAVVVVTGTYCDTTSGSCQSNTNPNADITGNFDQDFSAAVNSFYSSGTSFAGPCEQIQGSWYVDLQPL